MVDIQKIIVLEILSTAGEVIPISKNLDVLSVVIMPTSESRLQVVVVVLSPQVLLVAVSRVFAQLDLVVLVMILIGILVMAVETISVR